MKSRILLAMMLVWLVACSSGEEKEEEKPDLVATARAVEPSLVKVEITLKYDKGKAPQIGRSGGMSAGMPWRGRYYGSDDYVKEERPMELPGLLVAEDKVFVGDPMIHPRFIEKIVVVCGDQRVDAEPYAYMTEQPVMLLKPAEPLKEAKPITFDKTREPPYFGVAYDRRDGVWSINVTPVSPTGPTTVDERDKSYRARQGPPLLVTEDGTAVGLWFNREMPLDDSWKGSPLDRLQVSADELQKTLDDVRTRTEEGLPRVLLSFRSPKKSSGGLYGMRFSREEGTATEQNTLGVLLDEKRVLILATMQPDVTARLEKITVFPPGGGEPVQATFDYTLEDYGALLATLQKPMTGLVPLSDRDLFDEKDRLLIYADISVKGEQRIPYFGRHRVTTLYVGRKGRVFPYAARGESNLFIFDTRGRLVTIPLPFREKVTRSGYWGYSGYQGSAIPVAHLKPAFEDPQAHCDVSNVPLDEKEEARLAWMGVELQPMNKELARANKVSELTNDGESGAMVSYVYPGSPADKTGVKPGYILLRLNVEGQPTPVEVRVEESRFGGNFPWSEYSQLPEQAFEHIPQPWSSAENSFTRMLTNLGIGKKYTAEFFHDGKTETKDFEIVLRPTHYGTTPRFKSKALGLTVRDMTLEVRRYFQRKPEDPGVIISKIEMGSKASIAGLKPYEIITQVNDKPVSNVKGFEQSLVPGKEMRFSVLRMTQTRVVKITMPVPADKDKKAE